MQGAGAAALPPPQRAAARRGLKALIPFGGEPFLSYVLTSLADAGFTDVCLVVAPGEHPVRQYYRDIPLERLRLHFAVQPAPAGSADALLAARPFTGDNDFIVINADNDYPVAALAALRTLAGPGLIGFRRSGLLRGNVPPGRLAAYAVLDVAADGTLRSIREKPPAQETMQHDVRISMTCWRFDARIYDACRAVPRSPRNEYELTAAVDYAIQRDCMQFDVLDMDLPVLDLSQPEDAASIAPHLHGRSVRL